MESVINKIELELKKQFSEEATGHDWYHIDRVRRVALQIHELEGGDREIIELAALLHDISDHKFNGGDFELGGDLAMEILNQHGISEEIQNKVAEIVRNVSFKGSGVEDTMETLEGQIVQDADRIDALGAIGIARTFAYGGSVGSMIYDPNIEPKENQSKESYVKNRSHTINHFYEKLLLLEERMHTATGKEIAKERTDFMKDYLNQFYREWNGR